MNNLLIKISILFFGILAFISNVFAETNQQDAVNKAQSILFVSTAHTNTAKITLLKKVADEKSNQTWNIAQKSAKSLLKTANKADELTALFNQYDLVILDAVSVREASAAFDLSLIHISEPTRPY